MRSTESDAMHSVSIDRLPLRLQRLVGDEPGARVVVLIVSSYTANELGLALPVTAVPTTARRDALIQRRHEMGMTQEGLAHRVGVQTSTVGRWERGLTEPSIWAHERLCAVLDVSPIELAALLGTVRSEPIRVLHVVGSSDAVAVEGTDPVAVSA